MDCDDYTKLLTLNGLCELFFEIINIEWISGLGSVYFNIFFEGRSVIWGMERIGIVFHIHKHSLQNLITKGPTSQLARMGKVYFPSSDL